MVDSTDPDGDTVVYDFTWTKDGTPADGAASTTYHSGDTIPSETTREYEVWACSVMATDSFGATSESTSASIIIDADKD